MASKELYPPLVNSYTPAFNTNNCRVYFQPSKFNVLNTGGNNSIYVHATVIAVATGKNVSNGANGIILNKSYGYNAAEGYYVDILSSDIIDGWQLGCIYKIQIRLSSVRGGGSGTANEAAWLNDNGDNFSEWSTATVTKRIGTNTIDLPTLNLTINNIGNVSGTGRSSSIRFAGSYKNSDPTENLNKIKVQLLKNNIIVEDSGFIVTDSFDKNHFSYTFKKDLETGDKIKFEYETQNYFYGTNLIAITIPASALIPTECGVYTIDCNEPIAKTINSTIALEEDDARIALCVTNPGGNARKVIVRRSDSRTFWSDWDDIAIVDFSSGETEKYIYDYLIESNVLYNYGAQTFDGDGNRTQINITATNVIREFTYCYLLGEGNQQLRLPYNTVVGNYRVARGEGLLEPVNGIYPTIAQNAKLNYKTFNLNCLESFHMDENNIFISDEELYGTPEIASIYRVRSENRGTLFYDVSKEFEFRNKVQKFLQNSKVKLFKSPTEGNILLFLMNVQFTPEETVGRIIYNFNGTGYEVDSYNIDNLKKYGICEIEEV